MVRTLESIWCDDVRLEVGNKISYMGVYFNELFVPSFPFALEKLCLSCQVKTSIDLPFKSLKLLVSKNYEFNNNDAADELLAEVDMHDSLTSQNSLLLEPSTAFRFITANTHIILKDLVIDKPFLFRVKAITENGDVRGAGLRINSEEQI